MSEREMDVELVGGPADLAGRTARMPVDPDHPAGAGAYLISEHTPERPDDEDTDPRAIYQPLEGGPIDTWHFHGWFPASASDLPVSRRCA